MTEQLSIMELVTNASPLVQLVMAALALASIVSWIMITQRWFFFNKSVRQADAFEDHFWSGIDLRELYEELNSIDDLTSSEGLFVAGFQEYMRLEGRAGLDPDAVMQGVQRVMRVSLSRERSRLETHLSFLATVGSTSPYVGLFGTVWGIMNSFRSLANMSQATLASVAPGISEALIATAMGLFAAIPAVIAYNRYSAKMDLLSDRYEDFSEEVIAILHRAAHSRDLKD